MNTNNVLEESYNIYNNNPTLLQGFDDNEPNNTEINNTPNINMAQQYPLTSSVTLTSSFHKDFSLLKNDLPPPPPAENIMTDDLYKNSQQKMFPPPPTMYGVAARSYVYEQPVQTSSIPHTSAHDQNEISSNQWIQQQNIVDTNTQLDNSATCMWPIPVEQGRIHTESFFPENREQLDDGRTETYNLNIDRHNYLVTGQLSFNRNTTSDANELLPPPGLSRLVVGQTENNNELLGTNSMLPPGLNRLVTGKDSNNIDFQRQADGEVSQENVQRNALVHNLYNQDVSDATTFNTNDRSLYFAAGESDANIQRFITGVESDDALPSNIAINFSQLNLDNNGDDEVADPVQRNINVDGENVTDPQSIETHERDEIIDGAIDNSSAIVNSLILAQEHHAAKKQLQQSKKSPLSDERETEEREEDIEGANSLYKSQHKNAEIEQSSDISGNNLEANKTVKTKSRSNTKYNDKDSNDTESESNTPRKGNNETRYKRSSKEKKSRDTNQDKYQRRERGRDKYERRGKPEFQERDSDGSKYDTERSIREKQRRNSNDDGSIERKDRYGRSSKYSSRTKNEKEEKERQKAKYRGQHSDRYESSRKSELLFDITFSLLYFCCFFFLLFR